MRKLWLSLAVGLLGWPGATTAQTIDVSVDGSAAKAVLGALDDPGLRIDEALRIARLPGNRGLIRKARSYGRPADDTSFAKALVAAAHRDGTFEDPSGFHFDDLRPRAEETGGVLAKLDDPGLHLLDGVRRRIADFTPATLQGRVTGYLVVGGTSGGFAFGDPTFYLDVDRYPSATLAATIMEHELYHAVQALAAAERKLTAAEKACRSGLPHGSDIAGFLDPLEQEGTASYVGDVLALPEHDPDPRVAREREKFARNVGMVGRSIVQLELSVHGLATGASVSPDEVYALGFYGDEVLYALGYVMARAIAREQGNQAIAASSGGSGAAFVMRYVHLKSYGTKEVPALKPETVRWAEMLSACSAPTGRPGDAR